MGASRTIATQPTTRPQNSCFSSGPTAKRPGWSPDVLRGAALGRSHRAKAAKEKLAEVIARSRALLGLPDGYRIGIVPASDTGAMEMALWSLLGPRGVDVLAWESFGKEWVTDITKQLALPDARVFAADYGELPDLAQVDARTRDVVFTWNGTTSGVKLPSADWIPAEREGLTFCDATSAVFAMRIPWEKIDVATYSWQKVLGGEAQHGMLILSPRAVGRLEQTPQPRPLPKIFRLVKNGKLDEGIFEGSTINTPSMLCVEDALDGLRWAESVGGLDGLIRRSEANLAELSAWVERTDWIEFLAKDPAARSNTSICLSFADPAVQALAEADKLALVKRIAARLDKEGVAFDIASYRAAPAGLRIWGGATVETRDIEALLPWIEWAYAHEVAAVGG